MIVKNQIIIMNSLTAAFKLATILHKLCVNKPDFTTQILDVLSHVSKIVDNWPDAKRHHIAM